MGKQTKSTKKVKQSFADTVRQVVQKIPKGKVMTYKEVAVKAGFPGASRAVGTIMSGNSDKNVPCHRVIRSDGRVGEYNGLVGKSKEAILKKEGVTVENGRVVMNKKK